MEIADEQQVGEIITEKPYTFEGAVVKENGEPVIVREVKQADMIEHRKLRIETRLKLLAKWNPRKYGDKVQQELSGPNGGPIPTAISIEFVSTGINGNAQNQG